MKIYNYEYLHHNTNAVITISVRTSEGSDVADDIAQNELSLALDTENNGWYLETVSVEDF